MRVFLRPQQIARGLALCLICALLPSSGAFADEATLQAKDNAAPDAFAALMAPPEAELAEYVWLKRPVVIFADSPNDPRFDQQLNLLKALPEELEDRDVVILTDTDPKAASALRRQLRPRGFMLVLIGKDGGVKLRKPFPWNVRELTRVIDKMPMRQREVRDRRQGRFVE